LKKLSATITQASPRWSSPVLPWPTRGNKVIAWIEANCVYGEGDWYGQKVELREWQRRFIRRLYQYHPETRRRAYRRALFGVGKGNGKTPMASWIGAYELFRSDVPSPRVIIGAASLKQADLVFGDLKTTIVRSPSLKHFAQPYDLEVQLKDRPGVAERIAASVGTNDGARATAFIADELHEWEGRTARVYLIVDGAIAKRRDAFTLAITTAGYDRESLLYGLYEHGVKVSKGEVDDPSFLFEWYEPHDDEVDWADSDAYDRAMQEANPAYGDFNDPESLRHRFETIPRFEFVRYHANRWTSGATSWIDMEHWDACAGEVSVEEGDACYIGIDGAAKRDSTAVVAVFPKEDGTLHVLSRVFEPEDDLIDPNLVENYVRELCQTYEARACPFDPHLFFRSAQLLLEEGYPMEEFPQSHTRMVPASQMLYDAVMEGRLRHGGDPVLRSHADAAVARETGRGWRLDKDKATAHIDAVVALAMAVSYAEEDSSADGYLMMA
jgi:phage terminase large subunit-like protein